MGSEEERRPLTPMPWSVLLWSLPWLALFAYIATMVREPPPLPAGPSSIRPLVSVIVPARNEAHNIEACVRSLVASAYSEIEIIVVDDRSDDDTGAIARAAGNGIARVVVVDGAPVPDGWFGKQWACWQGARAARGTVLLFTDADTVHAPALLDRAVAELHTTGADCLTVIGRQIMGSFWERLVQPQVFTLLAVRDPRMGAEPLPQKRWRSAIANGQYIMFRRTSYDALGGHEGVRYEAAEDLRLAQRTVRTGRRLVVRSALDDFGTRMYRGLREIIAGWSKNMVQAGLQTIPPAYRWAAPPLMLLTGFVLWLLPPVALALALTGWLGATWLVWSASVTGLIVLFWTAFGVKLGAPAWTGLLYPLGTLVGLWILLRSWLGRDRVEWKGRSYAWDVYSDTADEHPAPVARER